ncbi:CDP-alcohol phosphatidyltransferase domain-containing protein [Rozella allomycis CSF55]|uniref:CDP-alcohol phosphatidyltransferase domain-containing protein n=1 Tax=Rozella allomycis (strain CSF55) TaxID=988480 RepID=A0A075AR49_ROZAC|nr:CDP-alcohol phosphatidyltransferase domain-containing protein [Rozella allomycis CSF55]|eukprot:EPZ32713.1 CDP-alcohol phosphatidyltransferase domain-containing protein [Rozella allomycis CSF55]
MPPRKEMGQLPITDVPITTSQNVLPHWCMLLTQLDAFHVKNTYICKEKTLTLINANSNNEEIIETVINDKLNELVLDYSLYPQAVYEKLVLHLRQEFAGQVYHAPAHKDVIAFVRQKRQILSSRMVEELHEEPYCNTSDGRLFFRIRGAGARSLFVQDTNGKGGFQRVFFWASAEGLGLLKHGHHTFLKLLAEMQYQLFILNHKHHHGCIICRSGVIYDHRFAFCMWMYSTFDNVDGKQARRTHSSSPLGHLFDHGCDALNCSIGGVVQAAAMGLGQSVYSLIIPFVAFIPFYLSTWEEYHTGIMYLGYINGPTEGLMIACLTMIFSGGPHIWKLPLKDSIFEYYTPSPLQSYLVIDLLVFNMFLLLFLIHVPVCLKNIHESFKEKKRDAYKLLMELLPLLVFTASSFIWVLSDNSYVLRNHIILFILTIGLVFGRMTTKIILSHVTKMPFPFVTVQLLPLIIGAILMNPPSWSK